MTKYISSIIFGIVISSLLYLNNAPNWACLIGFWIIADLYLIESRIKELIKHN